MSNHSQDYSSNIVHAAFRPNPFPTARRVKTLLAKAWGAAQNWRNRRIAIRELNAMPDVLLRDIGIERYQIKDAVDNFIPRPAVFRMRAAKAADPATAQPEARKAA